MGWFDGWFGSSTSTSDPLKSLDPKLREFLERESPVKIQQQIQEAEQAAAAAATKAAAAAEAAISAATTSQTSHQNGADTTADSRPKVPKESLFQDGRYAHLWKTYRPYAEIEAESKTDHEKLMDVLDGYKERKHNIGRAALENCALQQEEWVNCMKSGSWEDRMQMCRHQVQRFEKCYTMQTRFLKALGYQSVYNRPAQVEEDIQMHADKLYQRMVEQEKAIEAAKQEGLPVPNLGQISRNRGRRSWSSCAVEEAALRADLQAKAEVAKNVQKLWDEQEKEKQQRKAEGKATVMDRITGAFGGK
uniref:Autophagy protein n=1 Tax=Colletotrichum fructicola (strain Nara gc5) TaxID=1213859 RepID=L2G8X4_COLFN